MNFSAGVRDQNLTRMQKEEFDICIIGGGINGAGVARDAASRGMKVALVEARDFASGTSSRSSKLVHGGIRYLENLEFGLVFEALSERSKLFNMAPHLVHPLRFLLPLFKGDRVGRFKMGLGMWLYDALSMFEAPELHENLSAVDTMYRVPELRRNGLKGAFVYSDAYMDDDRLVIETLRSAHEMGAVCANYVSAKGAEMENGQISSVSVKDEITGDIFAIRAKHVVSTVGPWTDAVASSLLDDWKKRMRPTKGIHLTFKRERFPLEQAVVMAANSENRIIFGIPRNEMVIVGTTDTDYSGDPVDVRSEKEDVSYLLKIVNEYFPGAALTESDVVASYAGVRPLVDDGSANESKTSREHEIITDPRGVSFVIGGKYTTYRKIAEETMEQVLDSFPLEKRMGFGPSKTNSPLNEKATTEGLAIARAQVEGLSQRFNRKIKDVEFLVERHGEEAVDILQRYDRKIKRSPNAAWLFEAHHAIHETMCLNLADFYLRRTPLFLSRDDHGLSFIDEVADVFANFFEWSDSQREKEMERLQRHLDYELGWKNSILEIANQGHDFSEASQTM